MLKIVLDTNCLMVAAPRRSQYHWFYEMLKETLINIPELEEVTVYFKWNLIVNDPDDDKFVDAAVASNADYVITHDGDFKILRKIEFPTVRCISLREFHEIWFGVPMPDLPR